MPRIEELDLSEENKENIPPSLLNRDLSNITNHFDRKFKDYQDYLKFQLLSNQPPRLGLRPRLPPL